MRRDYVVQRFERIQGYELKLWRADVANALAPDGLVVVRAPLPECRAVLRRAQTENRHWERGRATNPESGIIETLRVWKFPPSRPAREIMD